MKSTQLQTIEASGEGKGKASKYRCATRKEGMDGETINDGEGQIHADYKGKIKFIRLSIQQIFIEYL